MADADSKRGAFVIAGWRIEPSRLAIIGADQSETHVTPRAMAVLTTLAAARGQVVTKYDLLDAVWPRMDVTEGVLSQTILELRNAFKDDARKPRFIETIRGVGFRLIPLAEDAPVAQDQHRVIRFGRRLRWLAGAVVLLLGVALLWLSTKPPTLPEFPRVMVVPFENLSADDGYSYFAQGMAEEIALQLARSARLQIISDKALRGAVNRGLSSHEAAQAFDADLILSGSVQRRTNSVKLVAELAEVKSADRIWMIRFERPLGDIFAVQDEVARAIAKFVLDEDVWSARTAPTRDLSAYDLYLQGRERLKRLEPAANKEALMLFRKALALDPSFAEARASLAESAATDGFLFSGDDSQLQLALAESERVIHQDPQQANAHYAKALALLGLARFRDAQAAIEQAIFASPNYVDALFLAGSLADNRGQVKDAVRFYERAMQLDPTLPRTVALARLVYLTGDSERALAIGRRGHALAPGAPTVYLAHLLNLMGRSAEAEVLCGQALEMEVPRSLNLCGWVALVAGEQELARRRFELDWQRRPFAIWAPFVFAPSATPLAWLAQQAGDEERAEELLSASETVTLAEMASGNDHWALRYNLASIAALRGQPLEALEWLDKAYAEGFRDYRLLQIDPSFRQLISNGDLDPLIARLLREFDLSALPDS